jgi:proteasome lid subunit RPN8/RPN11
VIELDRGTFDQIVAQARAEAPSEACGLIAGKEEVPFRIYPMRNADESPMTYRFDAKEQYQVMNEIEDEGLDIYAIYHSHTHTEAYPSATDRARAHWEDPRTGELTPIFPGTRYLILSLAGPEPVLRGFTFEKGEPVEEEVAIG